MTSNKEIYGDMNDDYVSKKINDYVNNDYVNYVSKKSGDPNIYEKLLVEERANAQEKVSLMAKNMVKLKAENEKLKRLYMDLLLKQGTDDEAVG